MRERANNFSESEKAERISFYINQANIYKNKGDFTKALLEYKKSMILAPNDPSIHKALGDIYSIQGILEEAISAYRQALLQEPDDGETWIRLILQYRAFCANMPDREKKTSDILEKLTSELKKLKNESMGSCITGNANLILHPTDPESYALQRDKAAVLMEKALEIDPGNIWAHLGVKDVKIYANDYEGAVNQLLEGISHNPDNSRLTFELAECYLARAGHNYVHGRCSFKAQENYKEVLKQDPVAAPLISALVAIARAPCFLRPSHRILPQGLNINPTERICPFQNGQNSYCSWSMYEMAINRFKEVIELSKTEFKKYIKKVIVSTNCVSLMSQPSWCLDRTW